MRTESSSRRFVEGVLFVPHILARERPFVVSEDGASSPVEFCEDGAVSERHRSLNSAHGGTVWHSFSVSHLGLRLSLLGHHLLISN